MGWTGSVCKSDHDSRVTHIHPFFHEKIDWEALEERNVKLPLRVRFQSCHKHECCCDGRKGETSVEVGCHVSWAMASCWGGWHRSVDCVSAKKHSFKNRRSFVCNERKKSKL